ncbi:MAG TPA: hypothetical protein PKV71_02515 [Calditrichia bacterium]|nr:hypothetical protein [Calditrichota bacterium]HQU71200.1 hypothetical protein [Calditrichia bacterium]HQV30714.1 hypothetical protein [Calditrichia bacterium]
MKRYLPWPALMVLLALLLNGCAGTPVIRTDAIEKNQSVKIYTTENRVLEGLITEKTVEGLTIVNAGDHQSYQVALDNIRRIEKSRTLYDYTANPVSPAEVEKYKGNKNTLGYATGGAIFGGLAGILVGLPIWLAADNPPPLFVGGATAVVGSIYMARKGIQRDREVALDRVRYIRLQQTLEREKNAENQRLEELKRQKEELESRLKQKKKETDTP